MDLAGQEIDPGKQAQRAVAPGLVIAREGRMDAGFRRQVRRRRAGLLSFCRRIIIRDDGHRAACLLRAGRRRVQDLGLFVNAQDLRHSFFEFRIAALEMASVSWAASRQARREFCIRSLGPDRQGRRGRPKVHAHPHGGPTAWSSKPQDQVRGRSLAFRQARATSHSLASAVMAGFLPGRELSSNAAKAPQPAARSTQRCTV